jgi:hypothetical protein
MATENKNPFEGLSSAERVKKLADELEEIRPLVHAEELHRKLIAVLAKAGLPPANIALTLRHMLECFVEGWDPPPMSNAVLLAAEDYGVTRDEMIDAALRAGLLKNAAGERHRSQLKKNMRDRLSAARAHLQASPKRISAKQLASVVLQHEMLKAEFSASPEPQTK